MLFRSSAPDVSIETYTLGQLLPEFGNPVAAACCQGNVLVCSDKGIVTLSLFANEYSTEYLQLSGKIPTKTKEGVDDIPVRIVQGVESEFIIITSQGLGFYVISIETRQGRGEKAKMNYNLEITQLPLTGIRCAASVGSHTFIVGHDPKSISLIYKDKGKIWSVLSLITLTNSVAGQLQDMCAATLTNLLSNPTSASTSPPASGTAAGSAGKGNFSGSLVANTSVNTLGISTDSVLILFNLSATLYGMLIKSTSALKKAGGTNVSNLIQVHQIVSLEKVFPNSVLKITVGRLFFTYSMGDVYPTNFIWIIGDVSFRGNIGKPGEKNKRCTKSV